MRYYPQLSTLAQTLEFQSQHNSDVTAMICAEHQISYATLGQCARQLAHGLNERGIAPGDKVAYLGKESHHYYYLLFACALSGAILVPINWRLTQPEVHHVLSDSQAKGLFFDSSFAPMMTKLLETNPQLNTLVTLDQVDDNWLHIDDLLSQPVSDYHPVEVTQDTVIAQLYTSGTTGLPKGVQLAHRSFFKVRESLVNEGLDWIDWYQGDVSLIGIPGFHIGGLWWASQGFNAGITNVIIPTFLAPLALSLISEHGITTACVVPSMIQLLLLEREVEQLDFARLRKIVYGGSPIAESLLARGMEIFDCDFAQIYGLTETGNTAICLPPEAHKPGTKLMQAAGRPYPCVRLKIIDDDGSVLDDGEVGEVCIQTPSHMVGYWQLPEATAKTLIDGWIHTGDAGYIEDEYLFICDRIKDTIIVAGDNVYPSEVENALSGHPGVQEVAVIGVPDKQWGEAIHAVVVREPDVTPVTPRALILFLKQSLADYKLPHHFEFADSIPRNPSGKILRRKLRDRYWQSMERKVN